MKRWSRSRATSAPSALFPSENELLLPSNVSFEIVSTNDVGHGLTMVQCKQTETLDLLVDFGAPPSTRSMYA